MIEYRVTASLVFPIEGSEVYTERFIMEGTDIESVRKRARLMLADSRYLIAVSPAYNGQKGKW